MRTKLLPADAGGTPEGALRATLRRLSNEFGVDVSPAADLLGSELVAWVEHVEAEVLREDLDGLSLPP